MDFISKLFVLPILLLALGTISVVAPILGIRAPKHRYVAIDGLRGFLAMFVSLQHSSSWYFIARWHQLGWTSSDLFAQFGRTSVCFFFMITSFLFFSKLIESYKQPFDWLKLYISRVLRIMPLYIFSVVVIFLIIGVATQFKLRESYSELLAQFGKWLLIMEPEINQFRPTKAVNLGVQWSLVYEWIFYCSLAPIGWFFFRLKTSFFTLLIPSVSTVIFILIFSGYDHPGKWLWLWPFGTGLVAAFIARGEGAKKILADFWVTPILLVLLFIGLFFYQATFSLVPFLCYSIVFTAIACGNSLFGLLSWKPCRQLGQISYSIYLLHGILLFVTFDLAIGLERVAHLSFVEHWLVISICTVFLVIICSFTYAYIERPGIESAATVTRKMHQILRMKLRSRSYFTH